MKETRVLCPECGAEFAIADKEFTTVATVIGRDSGMGDIYPTVVDKGTTQHEDARTVKPTKTAQERIDALRDAGVDVSHLFAMHGANGGEFVASNKDGRLAILDDNDPLFSLILEQGTVPNRRLFRRWVTAQMFRMLTFVPYRRNTTGGVTGAIHQLGYEYQWKMLLNELHAQAKMEGRDMENFSDRNRWFNAALVKAMAQDYIHKLQKRVDGMKNYKCKGIPYKRIKGKNIFNSDLHNKLYYPLRAVISRDILHAKTAEQLYNAAVKFNNLRIKMEWDTPQCSAWVDAYKGSGAYFTMQNLIRFHGCVAKDDNGTQLDKFQSLTFITAKAEEYKNGGGWRLLAVLKKLLADNNIDIEQKQREWRKK